jgi:hypothetical protein
MLSKRWFRAAKHTQGIGRFSPKHLSDYAIPSWAFRVSCAAILICAVATLELRAQNPVEDPCNVLGPAPAANSQSVSAVYNNPTSITLTASGRGSLRYAIVTIPAYGSLSGAAPNLTYTPIPGYHGLDSFTFKATNSFGTSSPATLSITVLTAGKLPPDNPPKSSDNIEDFTRVALACEWKDADMDGVTHVLSAFQLLTSSSQAPDLDGRVLKELEWADHPNLKGLYRAAMGDPDEYGHPTVQGLPNFLDALAKANNLKENDRDLFNSTNKLIDKIFSKPPTATPPTHEPKKGPQKAEEDPGPVAIARINTYFSGKEDYVALYLLLDAYPKPKGTGPTLTAATQEYANALEKFRAAFEMDTDRLAKQVAARITAQKQ